jgi:signal transduction histidine kinase
MAEKNVLLHLNYAEVVLAKTYIYLKDYKTALYQTERQIARTEEDDYQSLEYVYSNFVLIYSAQGDIKKASENIRLYDRLKSKMSNENMHNAIQNMEVKYETAKKDLVIERQQTEMERKNTRFLIILGVSIAMGLLLTLSAIIVVLYRKRSNELAQTNVTKDKFFSIISHDLKNPAVAQRDALQILLENIGKWDTDKLTKYCKKLLKSANGQVDLLYTLLNWAHLQTGRITYHPVKFKLSNILQSDLDIAQNMADGKGVMIDLKIPENTLVTGDMDILNIVVRNLLTNAVKFTPTGGTVTLNINETGGKYTVSVSDTGIGMTEEQKQNLFQLDIKQSREGTAGEQGSGLGLIVCKDMLEKHGSKLFVESEVGKGSRFWFEVKK